MMTKGQIAARKAVETKGPEERRRAAFMAAWTRKVRKDDAANPWSRQNCKHVPASGGSAW